MNGHIVQARVAFNGVIFAIHLDDRRVMAPTRVIHFHLGVAVLALGIQCDDRVLLTHFDIVARQLPTQTRSTFAGLAPHKRGQSDQEVCI